MWFHAIVFHILINPDLPNEFIRAGVPTSECGKKWGINAICTLLNLDAFPGLLFQTVELFMPTEDSGALNRPSCRQNLPWGFVYFSPYIYIYSQTVEAELFARQLVVI